MYSSINMSFRIGSNVHRLYQLVPDLNMIYNTYWKSYSIVKGVEFKNNEKLSDVNFHLQLLVCTL